MRQGTTAEIAKPVEKEISYVPCRMMQHSSFINPPVFINARMKYRFENYFQQNPGEKPVKDRLLFFDCIAFKQPVKILLPNNQPGWKGGFADKLFKFSGMDNSFPDGF